MIEEIISGVNRARLLEKSQVNKVFTPHTPIKTYQNLIGRAKLVNQLIECLIKPGKHSLLFGDRGVGKSSLANAVTNLILKDLFNGDICKKSCDSSDTFASIFDDALKLAGIDLQLFQSINEHESGVEATGTLKKAFLEAQAKKTSKEKAGATYKYDYKTISPSWVGEKIKDLKCVIVVDEFDAITNKDDKYKVAELLKYLSDNSETVTVMLVGIAKSAIDLTAGHPSVSRCLMELHVDRMDDLELRKIIIDGSQKLGLIFQDDVVEAIVSISAGYPYFTHLIALKCSEEAIISKTKHVSIANLKKALELAVAEAKSTIGDAYDKAIRGDKSAEHKKVLQAASMCNGTEFTVKEISKNLSELLKIDVQPELFTRFLQSITCKDNKKMLRRIRTGVYQFSDPRMPSYIKMISGTDQESESP